MSYLREIAPSMVRYRLARKGIVGPGKPFNLTFSVTNLCQSRCKTCNIWDLYRNDRQKRAEELRLEEIERIFQSLGHVYIFNISGGEPFIRKDIVDIIAAACRYLTPGIIHIPTNAIAADLIEKRVVKILNLLKAESPSTRLTIKPSLDHIGEKHDAIRGVRGNFKKVLTVFNRLKSLQPDYPNFHVELGTIISRWNVKDIEEIAAFVTTLDVDSYRNEIAECRSEMFNTPDITPDASAYEKAVEFFTNQIRAGMKQRQMFQRITHAFRLVYYDIAVRILRESRQAIPCYAGISNAHLNPYGDVWACCTLGYEKSMGNLRDYDYNFRALWNSPRANTVREYIRRGECHCPMANQSYSNILLHGPSLLRVLRHIVIKA